MGSRQRRQRREDMAVDLAKEPSFTSISMWEYDGAGGSRFLWSVTWPPKPLDFTKLNQLMGQMKEQAER